MPDEYRLLRLVTGSEVGTNRLGDLAHAGKRKVVCDDGAPTGGSESNGHGVFLRACLTGFSELDHKIAGISKDPDPREWASTTANPLPVKDLAARWPECSIGA